MTEPTPDTPESELTGDGLRAALANDNPRRITVWQRGVGWLSDDEAEAAILAALPNREAAPREGLDVELRQATAGVLGTPDEDNPAEARLRAAVNAEYDRLGR